MPQLAAPDGVDAPSTPEPPFPSASDWTRPGIWVRALSFRNISAIYVFALIFLVFSLWVPNTFLAGDTWKSILDAQAQTAILAIGLVIALSAGAFDLAIGSELGLGAIVCAWLMVNHHFPIIPAILITLAAGSAVGLLNGLLIVRARIDSFIATLGVSSVLLATIDWLANSQQIVGLTGSFQGLANNEIAGITLPVYFMVAVAIIVWYVLERTPLGRQVFATGGNIEAARLAGIRVSLVTVGALIACGVIAAFSGLLESSQLGSGDPTIGPAYLLPAFSAAFLGSTQFRGGRFNVWGTLLAVYVLAAGVKGLQLAGAPIWIPDMFNGVALLLAVGLARYQGAAHRAGAIRRIMRFDRPSASTEVQPG